MPHSTSNDLIWILVAIVGLLLVAFVVNELVRWFHSWVQRTPLIRISHRKGPIIAFPGWRVRMWHRIVKHYRLQFHQDGGQQHHPPSAPGPTRPTHIHKRP